MIDINNLKEYIELINPELWKIEEIQPGIVDSAVFLKSAESTKIYGSFQNNLVAQYMVLVSPYHISNLITMLEESREECNKLRSELISLHKQCNNCALIN